MIKLDALDESQLTKIDPITKEQYNKFIELLKKAIEFFKSIPEGETIRVISHLDADGITSGALMVNALQNENKDYKLTIYAQLTDEVCQEIAKEKYTYYIITDLGSGQLTSINKHLTNKKVLILDHHVPQEEALNNIIHINPHLVGIDGSNFIAGSGVVFFFSSLLNEKNYNQAHLAVIGSIGDVQEQQGFTGLNNIILDIAVERNKIQLKKELNLFGKQTRPLFKLLEFSSDLEIPGVTGNQNAAVLFLNHLEIKQTDENNNLRPFSDLTEEEKKKLAEHIIIKRFGAGLTDQSKIFGTTYELLDEKKGTFKDAKEYSSILNACGRLDQAKTGVYACLNEPGYKNDAHQVQKDYKIEIVHGMNWIEKELKNKSNTIIQNDKFMIINAQTNILYTIAGTVASILTMSNKFPKDYYVLSLAHNTADKAVKVSLRVVGNNKDIDLQKTITTIIEKLGYGEAGGHQHAAGAIIPIEKETEFLQIANEEFEKL
jgi:single-stranded-DNA-specific exonuclease